MKPTTFLSNLSLWAVQLIAMLLEVLFSPSVFEEGQTQKALTFGTVKASTLISSTMKTSDQCVETSVANHLPTKDCRTTAWAMQQIFHGFCGSKCSQESRRGGHHRNGFDGSRRRGRVGFDISRKLLLPVNLQTPQESFPKPFRIGLRAFFFKKQAPLIK